MSKRQSSFVIAAGLACAGLLTLGEPKNADAQIIIPDNNSTATVSAMEGFGWPNSAKTCFQNSWSLNRNLFCSGTTTFLMPLTVAFGKTDTYRYITTRVRGYGSGLSTGRVTCKTIVNTISNGARISPTVYTTGSSNTYQWLGYQSGEFFLDSVQVYQNVEAGEVAHVECSVPKNVGLESVAYAYGDWIP